MAIINLNLWQTWAYNESSGAVTAPVNGSWVQALAEHLGILKAVNGSWIQAIAEDRGITAPVNDSWIQALAIDAGATEPINGSWLWALATLATPPSPPIPTTDLLFAVDPTVAPTGTTVPDASGNGNTGTMYTSGVSHNATTNVYDFTGASGNRIEWGDIGDTYTDLTTIQWINIADTGTRRTFLEKWDDQGANRMWSTAQNASYWITYISKSGNWENAGNLISEPGAGTWFYLISSWDSSTGDLRESIGTTSSWNGTADQTTNYGSGGLFNSNAPWQFGTQLNFGSQVFPFKGSMGHIYVYKQLLSDTDREAVWNATKGNY